MLYIIYGLIILIIIILYFIVKDKKEYINKLGKTMVISGITVFSLGLIINILLNTFLNKFNILKISSLIFEKFINSSIILIIIGIIELLISKIIRKTKSNQLSNQ